MIPVTPDNALWFVALAIFHGIGLVVTYYYIRYKQRCGDFKGIPSFRRAVAFTIFIFAVVIVWTILWEEWIVWLLF